MIPVFLNDVLQLGPDRQFVLIGTQTATSAPDGKAALILLEKEIANPLPTRRTLAELAGWDARRELRVVEHSPESMPPAVGAADIVVRDLRWQRIEGLVGNPALYDRKSRNKLLNEHAQAIGSTKETLLSDLRRYWLKGQNKDALLGDFWRCGHPQQEDESVLVVERKGEQGAKIVAFASGLGQARGRRPKGGKYVPLALSKLVRAKVLEVAKRYFLEDERRSIRATTDHVVRELFALRDENGELKRGPEGEALLKPLGQRPTEHQVRYLLRKALGPSETFKRRVGDADHDNNHAAATGSILDDCLGPGDVYEIDATVIDLWVVAEADHQTIIGKPTLYLVVDRDSRLIVGFHISLENPQWEEAKLAILSICSDWEALCKRFSVAYRPDAFPARGVFPNRFAADRAEMLSFMSNILCDGLEQQVTNVPSKKSKSKSCVEGSFHETNVPIKDSAPGYEFPRNARKRQGKQYDKDASLTLTELIRIYLELVIAHNLKVRLGMPLSPEDVYKGWKATPASLWQRGIERRMAAPARYSYEYVRSKLMPLGEAIVQRDGVHFRGLIYTFDQALSEDWFARASLQGRFTVTVAYSSALVDSVVIHDPFDKRKTYSGRLTSDDAKRFTGYSWAEVRAYMHKSALMKHDGTEHNQAHRVGLAETISAVGEAAYSRMKSATRGVKHGTRYRDAVAIRKAEAQKRRQSTHSPIGSGCHIAERLETAVAPPLSQTSLPAPQPKQLSPTGATQESTATTVRIADTAPDVLVDLANLLESQS